MSSGKVLRASGILLIFLGMAGFSFFISAWGRGDQSVSIGWYDVTVPTVRTYQKSLWLVVCGLALYVLQPVTYRMRSLLSRWAREFPVWNRLVAVGAAVRG